MRSITVIFVGLLIGMISIPILEDKGYRLWRTIAHGTAVRQAIVCKTPELTDWFYDNRNNFDTILKRYLEMLKSYDCNLINPTVRYDVDLFAPQHVLVGIGGWDWWVRRGDLVLTDCSEKSCGLDQLKK
jgi:hypothetical protein